MDRIGNIVQHKEFGKVEIYGLNKETVQIIFQDTVYLYEWDEVSPIKLTEQLLLEIECVKKGLDCDFIVDDFLLLRLEDEDWSDVSFDVYKDGAYLTCIQYLHELQNLYYTLTYSELI